jgi:PKHD-type hydroxylase
MPKKLIQAEQNGTIPPVETKTMKTARAKKTLAVSTEKTADNTFKTESSPSVLKIQQPSTVWPFQLDHVEDWAYFQGAFSSEDCQKIVEIGNSRLIENARIRGNQVDTKIRDSKTAWIMPNDDSDWVFRRVTDIIVDLNSRFFKFDLFGFIEGFQFTRYDAPGGKYNQHVDRGLNTWTRKLSFTLQLSDPKDYKGGELELLYGDEPTKPSKEQGFIAVFPSYVLHRVTPVTKGTRYSLVAWITGPSFK